MNEMDIVRLTADFEELPAGTEGTIVTEYDGTHFEVEFFDDDGDTIGVFTIPADILELVF
ncbi:MAG: DUF4926 domain-containing protein [bacterium]|nr:DUF4926 domain-containing protein [bacterium]